TLAERTNLAGVRHILLVLSGKGGVGKSTISTELALALRSAGKRVSEALGCWALAFPFQPPAGLDFALAFHVGVLGGQRVDSQTPLCFGVFYVAPFISVALIKQFVTDVAWGDLDFLIVDTPPGTSDEHISTVEALRPYQLLGAILVTTPQ
ncbi:NUBP2 factor, partial [Pteruthius melanotis]|nr:NUBP2 factor [Pteruthius melanotis]